jgi:hypothetical protein
MKTSWSRNIKVVFAIVLLCLPAFTIAGVKASDTETSTWSDDFSSNSGQWQYLGDAYRDQTNQSLVLTTSGYEHVGIAVFSFPIQGAFTASFRYKAGGGWYGDGLTLFFYKNAYPSTIDHIYSGNHLGFNSYSPIAGYGVEFDAWQNIPWDFEQVTAGQTNQQGDPSNSHIGLVKDYTGNHLAYANDKRVEDNNWHQARIEVKASSVKVFVDQNLVLEWSGTLDRTYSGFGISGATGGGGSNWHIIDDFSITTQELKKPALSVSCVSSITESSFNVKINGALNFDGNSISGAPIRISYSVNDGDSWQDLTTVHTDSDGSYSALWLLQVTGDYLLKAVYNGSERYLSTSKIVNFAIEPCEQQKVFSINSNSTITQLVFSSTNNELCFNVSGSSGTSGYVEVYIPKSLLNDTSTMKVYLDNNQIDYTAYDKGDYWLLYFTYNHSSHTVTVQLNASGGSSLPFIAIAAIIVSIVAAGIGLVYAEYRLYYRNKPKQAITLNAAN